MSSFVHTRFKGVAYANAPSIKDGKVLPKDISREELANVAWHRVPMYLEHQLQNIGRVLSGKVDASGTLWIDYELFPEKIGTELCRSVASGNFSGLSIAHRYFEEMDTRAILEISVCVNGKRPDTRTFGRLEHDDAWVYRNSAACDVTSAAGNDERPNSKIVYHTAIVAPGKCTLMDGVVDTNSRSGESADVEMEVDSNSSSSASASVPEVAVTSATEGILFVNSASTSYSSAAKNTDVSNQEDGIDYDGDSTLFTASQPCRIDGDEDIDSSLSAPASKDGDTADVTTFSMSATSAAAAVVVPMQGPVRPVRIRQSAVSNARFNTFPDRSSDATNRNNKRTVMSDETSDGGDDYDDASMMVVAPSRSIAAAAKPFSGGTMDSPSAGLFVSRDESSMPSTYFASSASDAEYVQPGPVAKKPRTRFDNDPPSTSFAASAGEEMIQLREGTVSQAAYDHLASMSMVAPGKCNGVSLSKEAYDTLVNLRLIKALEHSGTNKTAQKEINRIITLHQSLYNPSYVVAASDCKMEDIGEESESPHKRAQSLMDAFAQLEAVNYYSPRNIDDPHEYRASGAVFQKPVMARSAAPAPIPSVQQQQQQQQSKPMMLPPPPSPLPQQRQPQPQQQQRVVTPAARPTMMAGFRDLAYGTTQSQVDYRNSAASPSPSSDGGNKHTGVKIDYNATLATFGARWPKMFCG